MERVFSKLRACAPPLLAAVLGVISVAYASVAYADEPLPRAESADSSMEDASPITDRVATPTLAEKVEEEAPQSRASRPYKFNFKRILAEAQAPDSIVRHAVAKVLAEPPTSNIVDLYISQLQHPRPKTVSLLKLEESEPRLTRHLRGKSPVSMPSPEEIQRAFAERTISPEKVFQKPEYNKAMELYRQAESKAKSIQDVAPELPSCPQDIVRALKLEDATEILPVHGDDFIEMDWLFIRAQPPGDNQEIFGKDTIVHVYSTKPNDYVSIMAARQGIECLPYRVRMTSKYAVHMMGLAALKNYDTKKSGTLYEGIRERLRDYR